MKYTETCSSVGSESVNVDSIEKNIDFSLPTPTSFEPHFKKKKVSTRHYNEDYLKYGFIKCERPFEMIDLSVWFIINSCKRKFKTFKIKKVTLETQNAELTDKSLEYFKREKRPKVINAIS